MITIIAEEMRRWLIEMLLLYLAVVSVGVALLLCVSWFGRKYAKYRHPRTIQCPETGQPAVVEIDALDAALAECAGKSDLHLLNCSLWKERGRCEETCVKELTQPQPSQPASDTRSQSNPEPAASPESTTIGRS